MQDQAFDKEARDAIKEEAVVQARYINEVAQPLDDLCWGLYLFIGETSFRYCNYSCPRNVRLLRKSTKSSNVV